MADPWTMKATKAGDGNGKGFEVPPKGLQAAVLVGLIDMGTRKRAFEGKEIVVREVALVWELTDSPMSGTTGRNHAIAERFTLSLNEKAKLRKLLKDWLGKVLADDEEFNLKSIVGTKCLVDINHAPGKKEGQVYANFGGVSPPVFCNKPVDVRNATVKPLVWSVEDGDVLTLKQATWLPRVYGAEIHKLANDSEEYRTRHTDKSAQTPAQEAGLEEEVPGVAPVGAGWTGAGEDEDIPF